MKKFFIYFISTLLAVSYVFAEEGYDDDSLAPKTPRQKRIEKGGKLFGDKTTLNLFGGGKKNNGSGSNGKSLNVNSYLWQASLDVVTFMPLAISDTAGGVISTDWYEDPDYPAQRYKVNIVIKSTELKPNALQVNVFKQELKDNIWRGTKASPKIGEDIEEKIFTRARELKLAQQH